VGNGRTRDPHASDDRSASQPLERGDPGGRARLIEELRIYQEELETQNEQLRGMQLELERSRDHYRALFDSGPDGHLLSTHRGRVSDANAAACRLLGVPRDAVLDSFLVQAFAREHQVDLLAGIQRLLARGAPFDQELRLARGPIWVRVQVVRLEGGHDREPRLLVALSDVSARRGAERALRESEARYRELFEETRDGVCVVDPATDRVLDANPAAERLFGREGSELRGSRWSALVGAPLSKTAARDRPGELELRCVRPDGSALEIEAAFGASGSLAAGAVLVSLRDVSERNRARAERAKLEASLRHAQKLEALGRFSGGVAHDFNNLLTVIGANAATLRGANDLTASDAQAALDDVQAAVTRASELVRGLLAFGRRQAVEPRRLDVCALVRAVERMMARVLGADASLTLELAERPLCVEVDPGSLEQVLVNLLTNARHAMPDGGTIRLRVAHRVLMAPSERFTLPKGAYVAISVEDQGTGIEPATLERIFEPFFTTKAIGEGTGLGLSMAYGFARQCGGTILVDTEVGRGSTFTLVLPEAGPPALGDSTAPAERARPARGRGERILVVEDDPLVQRVLARTLRSAGFVVVLAANRDEALAAAQAPDAEIALVLSDVMLPGTNGVEIVRALVEHCPDARVIFVSGFAVEVLERYGLRSRDLELMAKPFAPEKLLAQVRRVIDGEASRVRGL
jgi:PAS domain S-box-containing protein